MASARSSRRRRFRACLRARRMDRLVCRAHRHERLDALRSGLRQLGGRHPVEDRVAVRGIEGFEERARSDVLRERCGEIRRKTPEDPAWLARSHAFHLAALGSARIESLLLVVDLPFDFRVVAIRSVTLASYLSIGSWSMSIPSTQRRLR